MARGHPRGHSPPKLATNPFVQAQLQKLHSYPRRDLPKYLFRCYSSKSQGTNDTSRFYSAATTHLSLQRRGDSLPSLTEVSLADFASDAAKHLTYTRDDNTFKSPLVSFTSSLLVALTCARKADLECLGRTPADVKIAIIDTEKITTMHPILPCADLKCLVNTYLNDRVLIPGDSVDEYLAYDRVEVNASSAAMRDLMSAQLFSFVPEFFPRSSFRDKWPKPTLNLRDKLFFEPSTVSEDEYQLVRRLSAEFLGKEYQLALTLHLLSLRDRFVETDMLLKKAITASFGLEQLQNFVRVEQEFKIGPVPAVVYKYTSAGHGVANSTAPELRIYSALVDTLCDTLMLKQDATLWKMTEEGIVETICNPAGVALVKLTKEMEKCSIGTQLTADARAAKIALEAALVTWRGMQISKILDDNILGDIRSKTETAMRLAAAIRARGALTQNIPPPSTVSKLPCRAPLRGSKNSGAALEPRTNNSTFSSVFGSILASMDSPRKRKRTDRDENRDENRDDGENQKKSRKTL